MHDVYLFLVVVVVTHRGVGFQFLGRQRLLSGLLLGRIVIFFVLGLGFYPATKFCEIVVAQLRPFGLRLAFTYLLGVEFLQLLLFLFIDLDSGSDGFFQVLSVMLLS